SYDVGHSNGAIIASNNVYRTIVDNFYIRNGRLTGVGSWDSSDNAFAKISRGFIRDCWSGGLGFVGTSAGAPSRVSVSDVCIKNCGITRIGMGVSTSTAVERSKSFDIRNVIFEDSMISITGLDNSYVDIRVNHSDSATLTSTSIASGRTTNYSD